MAENQDQTPQPPQRPPARHSAPPHQPQPGFGDLPQGYRPGSDPLSQSTPAPPPPPLPTPPSQGGDPLAGTPQAPPVPSNWSEAGPPAASDRRDQRHDYRSAESGRDASDALFGQSPAPAPPPPPPLARPAGGASTPYQGQQQPGLQHAGPQHRAPQPPNQPYYAQAPQPQPQPPQNQPSQQHQAGQQQPPRAQHAAPPPQQPQTGQPRPAAGYSGPPPANQGQYGAQQQHGQQQYGAPQAGQPQYAGQQHTGQPQHPGQATYAQQQPQPPYGQSQHGQSQHPQQAQHGKGKGNGTGNTSLETAMKARLIGALVLVVAALATTGLSVGWIWTKADAVTPVTMPTGNQKPMKTVSPSVAPSEVPGKLVGTQIVAGNKDTMPIMGSAWSETGERTGLWSGAAIWLTVHKNYDGKQGHDWGNYVAFGQVPPEIPYKGKATLRATAAKVGEQTVYQLYSKTAKVSNVTHKNITVDGHPGHEITARVAVTDAPGLETYSTVMFAVIDRGDGTAAVAIGDIAGSTPSWQNVWRSKVAGIKINS